VGHRQAPWTGGMNRPIDLLIDTWFRIWHKTFIQMKQSKTLSLLQHQLVQFERFQKLISEFFFFFLSLGLFRIFCISLGFFA
jgi:hypothetical protein